MRRLVTAALVAACLLGPAAPAWAGSPSRCTIRVVGVYFKNLYDRWISAGPVDQEIDLLTTEPRLVFTNTGQLPPGKYLNLRIVLSETIRYAGSDGVNATLEGGSLKVIGSARDHTELPGEIIKLIESAPTWHKGAEEGTVTVTVDNDYGDRDDFIEIQSKREFPEPLTIGEGSKILVRFVMSAAGTVSYAWRDSIKIGIPERDTMMFRFPDKVQEIEVKVDKEIPILIPDTKIEIRF